MNKSDPTKLVGKILVTGGAGYLGSVLVPILLSRGYRVKVFDRFFFGREPLNGVVGNKSLQLITGDVRFIKENMLEGVEAIIDLAALSNDALGELNPEITLDINFRSRVRLVDKAKKAGVRKYILASSCSVYGFYNGLLDENSTTSPKTTYAKASLLAEKGVLKRCNDNFSVTVLRLGTLFGVSPRMRFDVVVNSMALSLFKKGNIIVYGGAQWRPLVHVSDAAYAFLLSLEADKKYVSGEIFNIGATSQSVQIYTLAKKILREISPRADLLHMDTTHDTRSYKVSCEKIKKILNYKTSITPVSGVREVYQALQSGKVSDTRKTKTFEWYKGLLNKDRKLFTKTVISKVLNE